MAKQTLNGKAFEYACLNSISTRYNEQVEIIRDEDPAYTTAKNSFDELDDKHKLILTKGADTGVEIIERLEPNLMGFNENDHLHISIQTDAKGQSGDVRDVIIRKGSEWEIGISAKHNHEAVKHSRLSPTINFGDKWMGLCCSEEYFNNVNIVFDKLFDYKGTPWSEVEIDKNEEVYKPLLNAFITEMKSLYEVYGSVLPSKLVKYLLGEFDFYKFVLDLRKEIIKVNAYNLDGTLNKKNKAHKSDFVLPKLHLPDRIFHLDYVIKDGVRSDNKVELICNNGWQFSFRIHNASSKIETSMKFDIQLVGVPTDIQSFIGII